MNTTTDNQARRVLLKLSGEAFGGGKVGIDTAVVSSIAREIHEACDEGLEQEPSIRRSVGCLGKKKQRLLCLG